ncbi:MAG: UDP-N-acetylglucosamine--N-acetylmuramyl-(pentapeptide) pyrophosphoryl-undecaprenol N-acetylglucosamine transferase [Candidatus Dormibacteria bacterium]
MAEALRRTDPQAVLAYVGRLGGPEARLVPRAGLTFYGLPLGSMGASPLSAAPRLALRLPLVQRRATLLVRRFRPEVVLATGGYVCVPVTLAARRRRIPVVLLEQNLLPGRAVRWLAGRVERVATSYTATQAYLPGARVEFTGNPVRQRFRELGERPAKPEAPHTLLVMGGSQGARRLNSVLLQALPRLLQRLPQLRVVHLTGVGEYAEVEERSRELGLLAGGRYQPLAFVPDVAERLAQASLVVMRAGGSSLAEVACLGRPMVLVPYPHAGEHQSANALPFQEAGAALVIDEAELGPERLEVAVLEILGDADRWQRMATASRALARPEAAAEVARWLVRLGSREV